MNTDIQKVIENIASDIITLSRSIMEQQKTTGRHSLKDSELYENVRTEIQETEHGIIIKALFDNYINYIEQGRIPKEGKRPPIDALKDWAINKGITPDNNTLWAISTAIWRDGYEARPILSVLDSKLTEEFNNKWANQLFEAVIKDLTKYFNE